jgi:hypothetical protein
MQVPKLFLHSKGFKFSVVTKALRVICNIWKSCIRICFIGIYQYKTVNPSSMFWMMYIGMFRPFVCCPMMATCFSRNIVEYVSVIYQCSKLE